ncbi:serine/threonine-protein kinase [Nonomuraea sp. NPDC048881]|uniref:WD40 repeat domain-containing serine/threonine protein kinase n=1 Tax=Nonomuraea sp. NPDC048881 TaxID=3155030 RepID=UPI0033D60AE8
MLIDGDPQHLGTYWLAGRLGAGGQGVVYEGYAEDGTRVAIKVLHSGQVAELAKEAMAAQRVASFCTARIIEVRLDGPRPYIVSEYVEGRTLRDAVSAGRRFSGGDLHRLATAMATALTAIHDAGVVHRDLKPDNVMLGPDGPRVIDFGIARTADMSSTATGLARGTPTYMAPEAFTGHRAGMPADVFAWGAIMLYAATGADPFEADSLGAVMHRVLSATPDLSALPDPLRPLVAAALSKEPLHRPRARELLLALVSGGAGLDLRDLLAEGGRAASGMNGERGDPALGTLAEDAYAMLDADERELAPEVFLRLVTVGERGDLSGRRAELAELLEGRTPPEVSSVTRILEVFVYLLGRDGEEIWLARPALPRAWPRYRRWVESNRDGLAVHQEILTAARRWDRSGRRDGDLFRGTALEGALQWAATARRNITLSPAERDFLAASAALTRRRTRRGRLVTLSLAGLLTIALVAGGLAVQQRGLADERAGRIAAQRDEAEAARLAQLADTYRQSDPRLAMQLSLAAWQLDRTPQTRAALTTSLAQREVAVFKDPATAAGTLRVLGADGRTMASVSGDTVRLWDLRTGNPAGGIAKLGLGRDRPAAAALSPTGRRLLVATGKQAGAWDLRTGRRIAVWRFDHEVGEVLDLQYDSVDRYALVRIDDHDHLWDLERNLRTRTDAMLASMTPSGEAVYSFPSIPPTRIDRLRVPDLSRQSTRAVDDPCDLCEWPLAGAPDGRSLAVAVSDGLRIVSPADGSVLSTIGQDGVAWNRGRVTFSADARLLATATHDDIQVWRPEGQFLTKVTLPEGLPEDFPSVPQVAFDGRVLRYLTEDRVVTVDLADLEQDARGRPWSETALTSGRLLATEDSEEIHLTTPGGAPGTPLQRRAKHDTADALALSQDGRLAAVGGSRTISVLDTGTRGELARLAPSGFTGTDHVVFSPDGTRLAAVVDGADSGTYRLDMWDWKARRLLWSQQVRQVHDVEFAPDGSTLAVTTDAERLYEVASGEPMGEPFGGSDQGVTLSAAVFTRDGRSIAVVDLGGRMTVYDVATRRPAGEPIMGNLAGAAVRSPREDVVAASTRDGRVRLFDLARKAPLGELPDGNRDGVQALAFTADGSKVLVLDGAGTVREQPVEPGAVAKAVCARAGQPLDRAQWARYITGVPSRATCAQ